MKKGHFGLTIFSLLYTWASKPTAMQVLERRIEHFCKVTHEGPQMQRSLGYILELPPVDG